MAQKSNDVTALLALTIDDATLRQSLQHYAEIIELSIAERAQTPHYTLSSEGSALTLCNADNDVLFNVALPCRIADVMTAIAARIGQDQRAATQDKQYHFGRYVLSMTTRLVTDAENSERIQELTDKEAKLLEALIHAGASGCERQHLLHDIWGYHPETQTRTLDSHIYRLRQKLADICGDHVEVQSRDGVYVLSDAAYCE